jgi:hypothetical protein
MFQLKTEIDNWCKAAGANLTRDTVAELRDHLVSDIEALLAQGLSDQDAFSIATKRIGSPEQLTAEFSMTCGAVRSSRREPMSPKKMSVILIAQSLVWGVLMIVVAAKLRGTGIGTQVTGFLFLGWLMSWMISLTALNYRKAAACEYAYIKRVLHL